MTNYYQLLGLDDNASEACIKRAFRCRAKLIHPDLNPNLGAKSEFQRLNEAYQVLKNPDMRRLYDLRLRHGTLSRRVYYRPAGRPASTGPLDAAGRCRREKENRMAEKFEKIFDQFLFFFMLMAGFSALFYGIYRAIDYPAEGVSPYLGIIFGVFFTALFLYAWDKKQRLEG